MELSAGQKIKYHRKKRGLSLRALAVIVGISPSMLSRYENDMCLPNALIIRELAKALKTTGDYLLGSEHREMSIQDSDELHVLRIFRSLNEKGRKRLIDYSSDLKDTPKYTKYTRYTK
jgi:transcriptional regulator with XRE-family HTH domain